MVKKNVRSTQIATPNSLKTLYCKTLYRYRDAVEALGNAPQAKMFLALAYAAAGDAARALETADAALAHLYESEYRAYESTAHQITGEVLLVQAEPGQEEAEHCFRTAMRLPHAKAPSRSSCVPRRASPGGSRSRVGVMKRARCSPKSTTGSQRGSTPLT